MIMPLACSMTAREVRAVRSCETSSRSARVSGSVPLTGVPFDGDSGVGVVLPTS